MSSEQPICSVTGTTGYLGGRIAAALRQHGWQVIELTRNPQPGRRAKPFQLGTEVAPQTLSGTSSLVHCAYDFKPVNWQEIHQKNVIGTEKLFRAAREAGVKNMIYLSTISAFEECSSLYGRAKLEAETIAQSLGAIVIRPGLIWSDLPGSIFEKLVKQVEGGRVQPIFAGGRQIQYLVHEQDLVNFVCECATGRVSANAGPVTVAHEQPWEFRQILQEIARAKGKHLLFVPVPWQLIWATLKFAEMAGLRLNFRSDSLISLMNQNPNPSFALQRSLGVKCRPFQVDSTKQ